MLLKIGLISTICHVAIPAIHCVVLLEVPPCHLDTSQKKTFEHLMGGRELFLHLCNCSVSPVTASVLFDTNFIWSSSMCNMEFTLQNVKAYHSFKLFELASHIL